MLQIFFFLNLFRAQFCFGFLECRTFFHKALASGKYINIVSKIYQLYQFTTGLFLVLQNYYITVFSILVINIEIRRRLDIYRCRKNPDVLMWHASRLCLDFTITYCQGFGVTTIIISYIN